MQNLSPTFITINAEHFQIMSLWKIGMQSISSASHEMPGYYLTGLMSCALAIERACKIILILDDLALKAETGQGSGIDRDTFQKVIKHDLRKALKFVSKVAIRRRITVSLPQQATTWKSDLLDLIDNISTGKCRYYAIDTLVGVVADDPLLKLQAIRERLIHEFGLVQAGSSQRAAKLADFLAHGTTTLFQDLDGTFLTAQRAMLLCSITPRINMLMRESLIETMKTLAGLIMKFDSKCSDFPASEDHYFWFKNKTNYLSKLKTWKG